MLSIALFENEPINKLKRTNYSYVKKDKPTPIRSLVRIVQKITLQNLIIIWQVIFTAHCIMLICPTMSKTLILTSILMIASCIYPISYNLAIGVLNTDHENIRTWYTKHGLKHNTDKCSVLHVDTP